VSVLAFINAGRRRDAKSVSLESRANKSRTTEKREEDGTSERGERKRAGSARLLVNRVQDGPRSTESANIRERGIVREGRRGGEMKDGKRDAEKRSPEMDRGDLRRSARADRARRIRA